ncbi:MAG TPA: tetratricopeptide repeat protein [Thermoanaerobaculia bacterium]|nr:tetratricopeptide repeat protein [Thermoanaerobaculia bacterium]
MAQTDSRIPAAPFDQGIFLLHYNRGKEAFQAGRSGEARRELEAAQKLRPHDSDVLNLLGLVYFKTGAYPEAEVIYRRLVEENPNVFILHSNLGLIYYKQDKLDEAERHLLRSVELRPNYSKSHLYLGLLYRMRKKFGLALEHLRFAGADKAIAELEREMKGGPKAAPKGESPFTTLPGSERMPGKPSEREGLPQEGDDEPFPQARPAQTAARKLQEAVDETPLGEEKRLDLGRRVEGASKTFALHENGFLEINFRRSVHVRRGTISSYSGNLKFAAETGLEGTTAATLVRAQGSGKIFVYEKGRKTFLLDLNDEFIFVEGANLLALEDTLAYRLEPIYDGSYEKKIDIVKIFGKGSLAISTSIEPLTMRVTPEYPLSISSNALVAWTGSLLPTVLDQEDLADIMIAGGEQGFKIRFEGEGVVVSEQ